MILTLLKWSIARLSTGHKIVISAAWIARERLENGEFGLHLSAHVVWSQAYGGMRKNGDTVLEGEKIVLVPYKTNHVPRLVWFNKERAKIG